MTRILVVSAAAFGAAVVLTPVAMAVATRTGVVDRPGPLKSQSAPVPYLGGVAVFLAVLVGAALGHPAVIAPLAGAVVLGVLDDRLELPAWVRLVGQAAIGVGIALVVPTRVGGVGGGVLVVAAAVVLMNGVNFLDGLDALAAGVVGIACVAFAVLAHTGGRDLAVAGAAALAGFLLYNRPPARRLPGRRRRLSSGHHAGAAPGVGMGARDEVDGQRGQPGDPRRTGGRGGLRRHPQGAGPNVDHER